MFCEPAESTDPISGMHILPVMAQLTVVNEIITIRVIYVKIQIRCAYIYNYTYIYIYYVHLTRIAIRKNCHPPLPSSQSCRFARGPARFSQSCRRENAPRPLLSDVRRQSWRRFHGISGFIRGFHSRVSVCLLIW